MAPARQVNRQPVDPLTSNLPQKHRGIGGREKQTLSGEGRSLTGRTFAPARTSFADPFNQTYQAGAARPEADSAARRCLDGLGDTAKAARAILASFSTGFQGPVAAEGAVPAWQFPWGTGQNQKLCVTLGKSRPVSNEPLPSPKPIRTQRACLPVIL